MKKVAQILLLTITFSFVLNAQNSSSKTYNESDRSNTVQTYEKIEKFLLSTFNENILTTSVVVGEIIVLLLVIYYWKRTKKDAKQKNNFTFKKNIKALRKEKIRPVFNEQISSTRKTLIKKVSRKSLNGKTINSKAKKLKIAKGELFLAAKIQQLQSQAR